MSAFFEESAPPSPKHGHPNPAQPEDVPYGIPDKERIESLLFMLKQKDDVIKDIIKEHDQEKSKKRKAKDQATKLRAKLLKTEEKKNYYIRAMMRSGAKAIAYKKELAKVTKTTVYYDIGDDDKPVIRYGEITLGKLDNPPPSYDDIRQHNEKLKGMLKKASDAYTKDVYDLQKKNHALTRQIKGHEWDIVQDAIGAAWAKN